MQKNITKLARTALVLSLAVTASGFSFAADWPQYQGPNRDGISSETGLARSWPASGPKQLWEITVGEGYGGTAIVDGEVYLMDRIDSEKDALRCLDLTTGKELWRYEYDAPGKSSFNGSRTIPTVDGDQVYTVGPRGDMYCFDRKTRKPIWNIDLMATFNAELPSWVCAQLPVVYGDWVIVAPQGEAGVVAMDKMTGATVWKSRRLAGKTGYVTPRLCTIDGVDQFVIASAGKGGDEAGEVVSFDASNGKTLWSYDGWQNKIPIAPVTPLPGNRIFITGGYDAGTAIIQVTKSADGWDVDELLKTDECNSQTHPPILFEDHLYVNSNSNSNREGMMCLTLDGEVLWKTEREPNFERGGMLLADGMILNLEGDNGMLHLIEPSPEGYKELAVADLGLGKLAWTPLALSDGRLIVRDKETMKCIDVSGN